MFQRVLQVNSFELLTQGQQDINKKFLCTKYLLNDRKRNKQLQDGSASSATQRQR